MQTVQGSVLLRLLSAEGDCRFAKENGIDKRLYVDYCLVEEGGFIRFHVCLGEVLPPPLSHAVHECDERRQAWAFGLQLRAKFKKSLNMSFEKFVMRSLC